VAVVKEDGAAALVRMARVEWKEQLCADRRLLRRAALGGERAVLEDHDLVERLMAKEELLAARALGEELERDAVAVEDAR
jgi:hypothetical protein